MQASYIVYALIAVGIFTVYMTVVHLLRRDRMRERVQASASSLYTPGSDEGSEFSPLASFAQGVLSAIGVNTKDQKPLQLLMQQAGITSPHAVTYFLFCKRVLQPVIFVVGAILFLHALLTEDLPTMTKAFQTIVGISLLVIGVSGANLYVTNSKQRRQQQLLYSFPEALDLLLVCIESGLGLDAALARVCVEMKADHTEIAQELDRTRMELTVMNDRSQALQNLAQRVEVVPIKSLVAALIQTEKFGTSLLDTLRVLSEDQRLTRLLNAENRAARIPVLITIPLIISTLPALFIVILGPPIIKVVDQGGLFGNATPGNK